MNVYFQLKACIVYDKEGIADFRGNLRDVGSKWTFRDSDPSGTPFAISRAADKGPHLTTYTNFVCLRSSTKRRPQLSSTE